MTNFIFMLHQHKSQTNLHVAPFFLFPCCRPSIIAPYEAFEGMLPSALLRNASFNIVIVVATELISKHGV